MRLSLGFTPHLWPHLIVGLELVKLGNWWAFRVHLLLGMVVVYLHPGIPRQGAPPR